MLNSTGTNEGNIYLLTEHIKCILLQHIYEIVQKAYVHADIQTKPNVAAQAVYAEIKHMYAYVRSTYSNSEIGGMGK